MKLKLQNFGHLMQRADSLEKTLMLVKIEGRRKEQQRMRWLDASIGCMDMGLLKLMSVMSVMPSNQLILCRPFLLPPSIFPSIRVFSKEPVLCIRWPKFWSFCFSISPSMNIQDLFPLGLTSLLFLLSRELSRVFSNTTVQKYSSLALSFLYGPPLISIHDYLKKHSFDYTDHF